ncbi:MAG: hypothetical protein IJT12_01975 [Paludibacteraceae bacterium]|nr:hypothetical protein [Paludibacteraceae bacterium]
MTDKDLDMLFEQSARREQAAGFITNQVMRTIRRDLRRKQLRKWAKLIGICFGMPILVVLYAYALFTYIPDMQLPLRIITFVLPLGTIAVWAGKQLHDFLLSDM